MGPPTLPIGRAALSLDVLLCSCDLSLLFGMLQHARIGEGAHVDGKPFDKARASRTQGRLAALHPRRYRLRGSRVELRCAALLDAMRCRHTPNLTRGAVEII